MTAVRWGVGLVVCCLLLQSLALAQVTTADIVGRVSDATGAVLPGATVTITNEGTGDVRSAPTTESGDYAFNLLPIGTWGVKVELAGFGAQNTRLILSAGDRARFDARLQLGQVAGRSKDPVRERQIGERDGRVSPRPFGRLAHRATPHLDHGRTKD